MTAPALEPVAAELAAAWETFREAVNPPEHLPIRRHFDAIVGALLKRAHDAEERAATVPAPYVHGDPRVDRWQLTQATGLSSPVLTVRAPDGFEQLAAWSFATITDGWVIWERPLRACEAPAAATEESALAALLTAWDSWPDTKGHHFNLLADITTDLEHHGMANAGSLTEAARAIVARAAERGQP